MHPITGICVVPESSQVWVSTSSPDLNIWPDFPVNKSQIVKPLGVKLSTTDYSVEIPSHCVIQQNGNVYLSDGGIDPFGKDVEGGIGELQVAPLYSKPIEHKSGGRNYILTV
jgi:hypothetical protein